MASQVFLDSKNRAYLRARRLLETGGQYIVNDEDKATKAGIPCIRVAQSNLVSIIPLTATDTTYNFKVLSTEVNQGNTGILPMEKRLIIQDVFFTSALGFYLTVLTTGGATPYLPIHYQLFCGPVPSLGGVNGVNDPAALMGLWSTANLEYKVGGVTVTPNWWMWKHMVINQTESNIAGTPINPFWDQQNYGEDGFQIVEPNWIINGGNRNLFTVTYDNTYGQIFGPASGNANSTVQFALVMVWDGWLAQNASSIMNNQPRGK